MHADEGRRAILVAVFLLHAGLNLEPHEMEFVCASDPAILSYSYADPRVMG